MALTPALLITPLINFVTGKIIEAGTGGTASKIVARANDLININNALLAINSGSAGGIPALQAAFQTSALTPGEALAVQSLLASLANQVALLTSIAGSTLLGQAQTAILDSILNTATATANAYVAQYTPPATPAAAPAAG